MALNGLVEMHSGDSRKIHPPSLPYVPEQTRAVLPSAGWSRTSETSVSSPDRSHPLPTAATPVGVAPALSASDTADRSPHRTRCQAKLPGHSSYRCALTGLPYRFLKSRYVTVADCSQASSNW